MEVRDIVFVVQDWPDVINRDGSVNFFVVPFWTTFARDTFNMKTVHVDDFEAQYTPSEKYIFILSFVSWTTPHEHSIDIVDKRVFKWFYENKLQIIINESVECTHPEHGWIDFARYFKYTLGLPTERMVFTSSVQENIINSSFLMKYFGKYVQISENFSHYMFFPSQIDGDVSFRKFDEIDWDSSKKLFNCPNARTRLHRALLYFHCRKSGLINNSLFSMNLKEAESDNSPWTVNNINGVRHWLQGDSDLYFTQEELELYWSELPIRIDLSSGHYKFIQNNDLESWVYDKTHFSVVTETSFDSAYLYDRIGDPSAPYLTPETIQNTYYTPKTYWKYLNYQPFLILSEAKMNQNVTQLGTEPYTELIFNDFDDEYDPRKRIIKFFENLEILNNLPENEIIDIIKGMRDKIKFNGDVFRNRNNLKNYLEPRLKRIIV